MEQVRLSGATAQEIRKARGSVNWGRGCEEGENGVRVGRQIPSTPPAQQPALSPAKSASSQARTTPSSDEQTSSEGELSSSSGEGKNTGVGTMNTTYPTIARPHPSHADWGSLISEENWVKLSLCSLKLSLQTRGRDAFGQAIDSKDINHAMENATTVVQALSTSVFSTTSGG